MSFYLLLLLSSLFPVSQAMAKDRQETINILVLGDSLSAAHGISRDSGWVALLQEKLENGGFSGETGYHVINASVSGETTQGGRNRLQPLLAKHQPGIVILELGANDGLRGFPLQHTHDNLEAMIQAISNSGAKPLLVGMKLPPNYGNVYTQGFEQNFADLAKQYKTAFVPFLMQGIATRMELIQADGLHPTAEAQPYLLDNIWPVLTTLLKAN